MKRKIISCLVIICVIINVFAISSVNAETTVATIGLAVSKITLNPGDEVNLVISANEINEAIAGISFSLNYNENLFDYVEDTAGSIWTSSKIENSYTILTKTYEGTTQTGEIITIKLKAKTTITAETTDTISITAIELSKDDASIVTMDGELSKDVTIKIAQSGNNSGSNSGNESGNNSGTNGGSQSGNNSGTNGGSQSGNNSGSNSENESGNNSGSNSGSQSGNNSGTNGGSQSGNNSESNSGSQSGNNSGTNSGNESGNSNVPSSNVDTTSTDGKIPQTGETSDVIVIGSAVIISLIGIVSFVVYKKIKI